MKPPGFVYNGEIYHGHPDAFPKASEWLQGLVDPATGKAYPPLQLDVSWWKFTFDPSAAKHERRVDRIVKNFQNGAHDYGPVMELLQQSCPTLDIVF